MSELVGKTVAVEITCLGPDGNEVDRFRTAGTIEAAHERWIAVHREGLTEPFGLPPAVTLEPSPDGASDYAVSLTIRCADPEALLIVRSLGFRPG
jgi:hypothetical protein